MSKNVLITGGTGFLGKALTELLTKKGYRVSILSRSKKALNGIDSYQWDISKNHIDDKAVQNADFIIHLAGAGVADKRWTKARKKEILDSRINSTRLLFNKLKSTQHNVKAVIAASAIGYYGYSESKIFKEKDAAGDDFLARVTESWEAESDKIKDFGIRLIKVRIGVVLGEGGGALEKMAHPIKLGIGSALGSGKQMVSWIHIHDLTQLVEFCLANKEVLGAYNAVAPHPASNLELSQHIARVLNKPFFMPNVPAFALKAMLGEMSEIVLEGANVSADKIQKAGFTFEFGELGTALNNLLK